LANIDDIDVMIGCRIVGMDVNLADGGEEMARGKKSHRLLLIDIRPTTIRPDRMANGNRCSASTAVRAERRPPQNSRCIGQVGANFGQTRAHLIVVHS
jgi:hypothetical protein